MALAGLYARAREFFEQALEDARAVQNREAERIAGRRLVELAEQEELNEAMERAQHGLLTVTAKPESERYAAARKRRR